MSSELRQLSLAVGIVFLSFLFVIGSMLVSFSEGRQLSALLPKPSSTLLPSLAPPTPKPVVNESTPVLLATESQIPSATAQPTLPASNTPTPPSVCLPPQGWQPITVQPGDTLDSLAATYATTVELITRANCLLSVQVMPGVILYVPEVQATSTSAPTATRVAVTPTICPPPPFGWVPYVIQPSDTIYSLSQKFGITPAQLQRANCLPNANVISVGDTLYVPYLPTSTFTPTHTPTFTLTPTTITPNPSVTDTPVPTFTPTHTPLPTDTPIPTDTPPPPPTDTPIPTPTDTEIPYPGP